MHRSTDQKRSLAPILTTLALIFGCLAYPRWDGPRMNSCSLSYPAGEPESGPRPLRFNGEIAQFESGVRASGGLWTFFHSNGQVQARGSFWRGALPLESDLLAESTRIPAPGREGSWSTWRADGSKESEGNYHASHRVGVWSWWHANGQLSAHGAFDDGHENGQHRIWHPNGQPKSTGNFILGKKNGRHRTWNKEGVLLREGRFARGVPTGTHRRWDANGFLREQVTYEGGTLAGQLHQWDDQGQRVVGVKSPRGREGLDGNSLPAR